MTRRYVEGAGQHAEVARVDAFLAEVTAVSVRHYLTIKSLSEEDGCGIVVDVFDAAEGYWDWSVSRAVAGLPPYVSPYVPPRRIGMGAVLDGTAQRGDWITDAPEPPEAEGKDIQLNGYTLRVERVSAGQQYRVR